jgi:uncharacterized protein YdhG (YjbR/CyaY superfamily)
MKKSSAPATIDEYIAGFDPPVRAVLCKVRAAVCRGAPDATEVISYRMPALRGRGILVYFAAFQNHIGFYPPIRGDARLEKPPRGTPTRRATCASRSTSRSRTS